MGYAVDADDMNPHFLDDAHEDYGVTYRRAPPRLILQGRMARNCRAVNVAALSLYRTRMLPYVPLRTGDANILLEALVVTTPGFLPTIAPDSIADLPIPSLPPVK